MVPPNQTPSKSQCKTLHPRRMDSENVLLDAFGTFRTVPKLDWKFNVPKSHPIHPPRSKTASCWSGTEGSVVITKRYLEARSEGPTSESVKRATEAPRDGLEGMEFVPPQRLNMLEPRNSWLWETIWGKTWFSNVENRWKLEEKSGQNGVFGDGSRKWGILGAFGGPRKLLQHWSVQNRVNKFELQPYTEIGTLGSSKMVGQSQCCHLSGSMVGSAWPALRNIHHWYLWYLSC